MISALFAAAILLAETTPAAAPAPMAAVAPAQATADGAPAVVKVRRNEDMICKQEEVLGSRIPKKVCYTRAEQEARSQEDQKNLQRMQSQFGKISN